jgi:3-isopropylmalate/(R)-2-methylmalate dehydratase small subunit
MDFGFKAVISASFADIFRNNSLKNGFLPIIVDEDTHQQLMSIVAEEPDAQVTVDLAGQRVMLPDGRSVEFPIDNFSKTCILEGLDQLGYLQKQAEQIAAYEAEHAARVNTLE